MTACGPRHDAPRDGSCPCGAVSRHPAATPAQAGDDTIAAELAEACEALWPSAVSNRYTAESLLPVVRRIAEQRAAEERTHFTTAMADLLRLTYGVQLDSNTPAARAESERVADAFRARIADHCRERDRRHRAAALTATPNHGRNAT